MEWMCKIDQSLFCADEHVKTSKAGCTGRAMDRWYLEVHTCASQRLMRRPPGGKSAAERTGKSMGDAIPDGEYHQYEHGRTDMSSIEWSWTKSRRNGVEKLHGKER